jgi:hypothetical protein
MFKAFLIQNTSVRVFVSVIIFVNSTSIARKHGFFCSANNERKMGKNLELIIILFEGVSQLQIIERNQSVTTICNEIVI